MIQHNNTDTIKTEKTIGNLFSMLDTAIDEMERGDVISEEEMWAELAEIEEEYWLYSITDSILQNLPATTRKKLNAT